MTELPLPLIALDQYRHGLFLLLPILTVIATALVVLVIDLAITDWASRRPLMWVAALGLLLAMGACVNVLMVTSTGDVELTAFSGFLIVDSFALFFQFLF